MLSFKNVWLRYGPVTALRGLELELHGGELMALLGPSGCGKTSTLQVAGGFLRPSEGRVLLAGCDITELPPEKRPTATVFQSHALFPHMTVGENVAYGLKLRGVSKKARLERAQAELERVGLDGFLNARVQQLSGGQQQRAAVARALVTKPKLILADEPTGNLDSENGLHILSLLLGLWKKGKTLIMITHNETLAESFPRVLRILDGKIIYDGPYKKNTPSAP